MTTEAINWEEDALEYGYIVARLDDGGWWHMHFGRSNGTYHCDLLGRCTDILVSVQRFARGAVSRSQRFLLTLDGEGVQLPEGEVQLNFDWGRKSGEAKLLAEARHVQQQIMPVLHDSPAFQHAAGAVVSRQQHWCLISPGKLRKPSGGTDCDGRCNLRPCDWECHVAGSDWFNEPDWFASQNPHHLLAILDRQQVTSRRKFRLAAVACCRRIWDGLSEHYYWPLDVAERYADLAATYKELRAALEYCRKMQAFLDPTTAAVQATLHRQPRIALGDVVYLLLGSVWGGPRLLEHHPPRTSHGTPWDQECQRLADIIRDIFGNPFEQVTIPLEWRTAAVTGLAHTVYAEQNYEQLPVLGDALEDAGCDDADLLAHCRLARDHVKGCWAVDLLL